MYEYNEEVIKIEDAGASKKPVIVEMDWHDIVYCDHKV